jgi:hypothetical protein
LSWTAGWRWEIVVTRTSLEMALTALKLRDTRWLTATGTSAVSFRSTVPLGVRCMSISGSRLRPSYGRREGMKEEEIGMRENRGDFER